VRFFFGTLVLMALSLSLSARAELPPEEYEKLLASATNVGVIEVTDVKTTATPADNILEVAASAKMISVEKAGDGLKAGDSIEIHYMHVTKRPDGWTGPAPIPLLVKGQKYHAHLLTAQKLGSYTPAARSKSFTTP
jgi:hypothetical protein